MFVAHPIALHKSLAVQDGWKFQSTEMVPRQYSFRASPESKLEKRRSLELQPQVLMYSSPPGPHTGQNQEEALAMMFLTDNQIDPITQAYSSA